MKAVGFFLDYIKTSPFKNVCTLFARHEFQGQSGNLPHIHAMIKANWDELSHEEKLLVNDCIRDQS